METNRRHANRQMRMNRCNNHSTSRVWSGLVILAVGLVFFLRNIGVNIPEWVISWHMLLIIIGLFVGYKRNFHGGGWIIMMLVGGFFTLEDITHHDMSKYYLAAVFIILGLFLIFKPKRAGNFKKRWKRWEKKYADPNDLNQPEADKNKGFIYNDKEDNDVLDSISVFGASHQSVYSKNFKGGDVLAIFGGCDVNLTQADFEGTIVLDVVAIFGGIKIIIPSSWEVKSEVTAIFGGLEDKRAVGIVNSETRKIVKIKGVAMFGGVDIRNF